MLLHKGEANSARALTRGTARLGTGSGRPGSGQRELKSAATLVIADGLEIVNRAAPLQAQNRGVLRVGGPGLADTGDVGDPVSSRLDST